MAGKHLYWSAFWWLFLAAYSVAIILLHKEGNLMAGRLNELLGLELYLSSTRQAVFIGAGALLIGLVRNLVKTPAKIKTLLLFAPLAFAVDHMLTFVPIERIHYVQYGFMTWLAYKAIGEPLSAAMMAFVVGYIDEAYQYWGLYADDRFVYFDWNDILVNFVAAMAILFFFLPTDSMRKLPGRQIVTAVVLWIVVASALVLILSPDQYLIGNDPDGDSFWFTSNIGTRYHVMDSMEGINVIGVVLILTIGTHWPPPAIARAPAKGVLVLR